MYYEFICFNNSHLDTWSFFGFCNRPNVRFYLYITQMAERLPNNIKTGQMYTFESISAIPVNECFALYRFPSLFVSICGARSPRKSTNAKSVKTEKRNILRLSSAGVTHYKWKADFGVEGRMKSLKRELNIVSKTLWFFPQKGLSMS